MADGTLTVKHYRFRNDDGSEAAASWLAAEDAQAFKTITADTNVRLRMAIEATVQGDASHNFQLKVSRNGGALATVGAASTYVKGVASSNLVHGANTTNQLTVPGGDTYVTRAGVVNQTGATSAAILLSTANITEVEWSMVLTFADLSNGDTLDFTLQDNSGDTVNQFGSNVRLTINPVGAEELHVESMYPAPLPNKMYQPLPIGRTNNDDAPVLSGELDEDFDRRRLFPAPTPPTMFVRLPPLDSVDDEAGLRGQPDEDYWQNPVVPVPPKTWQPPAFLIRDQAAEIGIANALPPDEDFWRSGVAPVPQGFFQYRFRDAGEISPGSAPSGPAVILKRWVSVQQTNLWCAVRVFANGVFDLDLLSTQDPDNGPHYVMKQVGSQPIAGVDGATAGYTQVAEMDVPWPAVGQVQIYGASGIAYASDLRLYYKKRRRH